MTTFFWRIKHFLNVGVELLSGFGWFLELDITQAAIVGRDTSCGPSNAPAAYRSSALLGATRALGHKDERHACAAKHQGYG